LIYDAIIIGADEAACAAAIEARRHGLNVLLVAQGQLNSESFLCRRSLFMHAIREIALDGIGDTGMPSSRFGSRERAVPLFEEAARKVETHAERQLMDTMRTLSEHGVSVSEGSATIVSREHVCVDQSLTYTAPIILLAMSNRPRRPTSLPFDDRCVCDPWSNGLRREIPRNLLVVGAEIVGSQYACALAGMGSRVTLLDRRSRMLRYTDRSALEAVHSSMQALGIDLLLQETIAKIVAAAAPEDVRAVVTLGSGRVECFDQILISAGEACAPPPIADGCVNIEQDERGFVITDDDYQTSESGIYSVGTSINEASSPLREKQGYRAMRNALGISDPESSMDVTTIFTIPEVAMAGFSEEMCERLDLDFSVGQVDFGELPRGQIKQDRGGLLKLIMNNESEELLGVHVVGAEARETIAIGASALRRGAKASELLVESYGDSSYTEAYARAASRCLLASCASRGAKALVS
jgi:NAD(P) transhydrogenase